MNRLRQAAQAGDIYELYEAILEEDNDVLSCIEKADLVDTPLHIAANKGHADFAKAMMCLKPSFGRKLNQNIYSPMHLAMQNGHKEVVLDLLAADKDLVRVKGREGYTALHYAAEKGDIDILVQFLKYCPACVKDVTVRNETALHVAAKNNKLEAVEILARFLWRTRLYCKVSKSHLLNSKDRNGNTALHIAASTTQPQMIKVLIECRVDTKEINNQRVTALKLLENSEADNREICLNVMRKVRKERCVCMNGFLVLGAIGEEVAVHIYNALLKHKGRVEPALSERLRSEITTKEELLTLLFGTIMNMSAEKINALLVVVTLILTATYQAILSPPGGVWQGEYPVNTTPTNNHVGESVMDLSFFLIFHILNLEVLFFTCCLTVGLIQAVTKSGVIAFVCEVLLASLMLSTVEAQRVIAPNPDAPVKANLTKSQILVSIYFLVVIFMLEIIRRFFLLLLNPPSLRFFREFFSHDM